MKMGLMYTDRCNYQCNHCMVDSKLSGYTVASTEVVDQFLEVARGNHPDWVCILGGEPLLFLDEIEVLVNRMKEFCDNILIYSNGTFLLDENKRNRIEEMKVHVRISQTDFHKDFWTDELVALIDASPYWKTDGVGKLDEWTVYPRGRALTNNLYDDVSCACSLVTGDYKGFYHSNRILIMPDGAVNIWCASMAAELANVFQDDITHALLVNRETRLREYLKSVNMFFDTTLFMCNEVCRRFKVTAKGIYRDGELMQEFEEGIF